MNIKYQSKTISYTIIGKGATVVFLHGFTENKGMWNSFVSQFAKEFQVITIDLPGHGMSDSFSKVHTMELMAEVVNAVMEKELIAKCTLVGHSMGGYASLAFAKLFPEKITGLVLFHSSATADTEELRKNRDRLIKLVKENKKSFVNSFIPSLFSPVNKSILEKEIAELVNISNRTSEQGITAALEGMKLRTEKLSLLKEIKVPILFIVGKQDSRIPVEKILPQIALPKRSYSLFLEDVGHMGFLEAKEETRAMVLSFINKVVSV